MSRGNSLIAGVVLIGMLGTLAVALQSANPSGESSAQVASAKFAATTPPPPPPKAVPKDTKDAKKFGEGKGETCDPASNNDIVMQPGGTTYKMERKSIDPATKEACEKGTRTGKDCQGKVRWCTAEELRGDGGKGNDCKDAGECDPKKGIPKEDIAKKKDEIAPKELQKQYLEALKNKDEAKAKSIQDAINANKTSAAFNDNLKKAFDNEGYTASEDARNAQKNVDRINKMLDDYSYPCDDPDSCNMKRAELEKEKADAEKLRDEARERMKMLADTQEKLEPGIPPPKTEQEKVDEKYKKDLKDIDDRYRQRLKEIDDNHRKQMKEIDDKYGDGKGGAPPGGGKEQPKQEPKNQTFPPQQPPQNQNQNQCPAILNWIGMCPEITCTIQNMTPNPQPGQPVTLRWQTTSGGGWGSSGSTPQSANITQIGQVPANGQAQVNVQQTTTYLMNVPGQQGQQPAHCQVTVTMGNPNQQCNNPVTYCKDGTLYQGVPNNNFCQQQTIQKCEFGCQAPMSGSGLSTSCASKLGDNSPGPVAELKCEPKIADAGMKVAISYSCKNSTKATGVGFSTDASGNPQLSGSAEAEIEKKTPKGTDTVSYGLACTAENGKTANAPVCKVKVNKPSIILVANPEHIDLSDEKDDVSTIGWVTPPGSMKSCVISSPTLSSFTAENKDKKNTSGSVKTPKLTQDTKFILTCETTGQQTMKAEVTVNVEA